MRVCLCWMLETGMDNTSDRLREEKVKGGLVWIQALFSRGIDPIILMDSSNPIVQRT